MRVGLIGFGAIGRAVCALLSARSDGIALVGTLVADPTRKRADHAPTICANVDELLTLSPDVVVEAAGHDALRCLGPSVLARGIDLLMVSVGALADPETEQAITQAACSGRSHAIVVSGAIGALDAIASAAVGGLSRVTHTTRKPPAALLEAQQAALLKEPRELFRGSAREGALRFPESINVAAAVSLAGIGFDRTQVEVVADPSALRSVHEIHAEGRFGAFTLRFENAMDPVNPRTSRLAGLSAVAALQRRHGVFRFT